MTPDPLPLFLLLTCLYLTLSARSLLSLMDRIDARSALKAEAQQKRWLAK